MGVSCELVVLVLVVSLVRHVLCVGVGGGSVGTMERATTWGDVSSDFRRVFNITERCADLVTFGVPVVDERQIATLPLTAISEDRFPCSGGRPLQIVTDATIRSEDDLLPKLGLAELKSALAENANARSVLDINPNSNMLVGWHAGIRACNTIVYTTLTLYFFIREDLPFRIAFDRGAGLVQTVTIPANQRALFIVPPTPDMCLFSDKSSNPDADVTLTTTYPNGTSVVVTLPPAGREPVVTAPPDASSNVSMSMSASPNNVTQLPLPPSQDANFTDPANATASSPPFSTTAASSSPLPSNDNNGSPVGDDDVLADDDDDDDDDSSDNEGSQSPNPDEGGVCFPGSARVVRASGRSARISSLRVGDLVRTGPGLSDRSAVIVWTHRDATARSESFIRVCNRANDCVTATSGHFVYTASRRLRQMGDLHVGHALLDQYGKPFWIVRRSRVCAVGLYNPHTLSGRLIVDGVVASAYTAAVPPSVAHGALLAPLRALHGAWAQLAFRCGVLLSRALRQGLPPYSVRRVFSLVLHHR